MNSLLTTDHKYREDCMRAEALADKYCEQIHYLSEESATAHSVLDARFDRTSPYFRHGNRILSLPERINAAIERIAKSEADGWVKYNEQIRANEALLTDLKALRESFDRIEMELRK